MPTPTATLLGWRSCRSTSACGWGCGPPRCGPWPRGPTCTTSARSASPTTILNKPGGLTDEERAWIQQHPIVGSDIVGRAPSLRDALAVIRQHHERFDGQGYPDGLAGQQISLAARIVAVADVWDALTSDRAYRPAWPPDRALRHLEAGRGSHFDPVCLDAFLALMAERGHRPGHGEGDAAVADAAAEACHDDPKAADWAATPPVPGQR